jgi:hypothetical protein
MPAMLTAAGWLEGSPKQILIQGEPGSPDTAQLVAEVWRRFLPRRVLVRIDGASRPFFAPRNAVVADLPADASAGAMAYVCENFVCQLPTREPAALGKLLEAADSNLKRGK